MKNKIEKKVENFGDKKITRKEAIKKTGLMAASAATMMVLLKTKKAQATSLGCNKSGSTTPIPQSSGNKRGPWKNKNGNGHQNKNGNGHQNHNGNGWGHGGK
jgi:hypothetical protein